MALTNSLLSCYPKLLGKYFNSFISNIALISFIGYSKNIPELLCKKNTADYEYAYCR
jgi:hypothetical protein